MLENKKMIKIFNLVNNYGVSYINFRKTLKPNLIKLWRDLLIGYITLFLIVVMQFQIFKSELTLINKIIILLLSSILSGLMINYLIQFFHEAAHFNLFRNKSYNDYFANIFMGWIIGLDIKKYRKIHLNHHKYLGTTKDSEISYFNSLDIFHILKSLFFINVLLVLRHRNKYNKFKENKLFILSSLCTHIIIIVIFMSYSLHLLVISWIFSIAIFFPLFNSIRQILEHRSEKSDKSIDYTKVNHGEVNRIFKGLISSILGGAGFKSHMIHHFDMTISYTNFDEVERFLMDTSLSNYLKKNTTSYSEIFLRLYGK